MYNIYCHIYNVKSNLSFCKKCKRNFCSSHYNSINHEKRCLRVITNFAGPLSFNNFENYKNRHLKCYRCNLTFDNRVDLIQHKCLFKNGENPISKSYEKRYLKIKKNNQKNNNKSCCNIS